MSYADRVRAGVALLDEKKPGWHTQIDLDDLRMDDCALCTLGQLFGFYEYGKKELGLDSEGAIGGGFEIGDPFDGGWSVAARDYAVLNRLWTYVIRQRQEAEQLYGYSVTPRPAQVTS